jgi:hypothetical protein
VAAAVVKKTAAEVVRNAKVLKEKEHEAEHAHEVIVEKEAEGKVQEASTIIETEQKVLKELEEEDKNAKADIHKPRGCVAFRAQMPFTTTVEMDCWASDDAEAPDVQIFVGKGQVTDTDMIPGFSVTYHIAEDSYLKVVEKKKDTTMTEKTTNAAGRSRVRRVRRLSKTRRSLNAVDNVEVVGKMDIRVTAKAVDPLLIAQLDALELGLGDKELELGYLKQRLGTDTAGNHYFENYLPETTNVLNGGTELDSITFAFSKKTYLETGTVVEVFPTAIVVLKSGSFGSIKEVKSKDKFSAERPEQELRKDKSRQERPDVKAPRVTKDPRTDTTKDPRTVPDTEKKEDPRLANGQVFLKKADPRVEAEQSDKRAENEEKEADVTLAKAKKEFDRATADAKIKKEKHVQTKIARAEAEKMTTGTTTSGTTVPAATTTGTTITGTTVPVVTKTVEELRASISCAGYETEVAAAMKQSDISNIHNEDCKKCIETANNQGCGLSQEFKAEMGNSEGPPSCTTDDDCVTFCEGSKELGIPAEHCATPGLLTCSVGKNKCAMDSKKLTSVHQQDQHDQKEHKPEVKSEQFARKPEQVRDTDCKKTSHFCENRGEVIGTTASGGGCSCKCVDGFSGDHCEIDEEKIITDICSNFAL